MKARLDKKIVAALPFLESEYCLIYDRRYRIVWASNLFCAKACLAPRSVLGMRIERLFVSVIEQSPRVLRKFFDFRKDRAPRNISAVLEMGRRTLPGVYVNPREEKNGVHVFLNAMAAGRGQVLLKINSERLNITRTMGERSQDYMLTLDARGRIVGATDGLSYMLGKPLSGMFGRGAGRIFLPGMFSKALASQTAVRKAMLKDVGSGRGEWETVYAADFSSAEWKKYWAPERHLRFKGTADGLRVDSCLQSSGFLVFHESLDTEQWDYRWEVQVVSPVSRTVLALYFNGWDCCPDIRIASPDLGGYLAGYYKLQNNMSLYRIKRRGWIMTEKSVSWDHRGEPFRLTVEKSGGAFRLDINGRKSFSFADPEFALNSEYRRTGMVISSFPLVLQEAVLRRRRRPPQAVRRTESHFDLRFATHPEELYEGRFFERMSENGLITDLYLRNVTELRRAQKAMDDLVLQKTLALDQIHDELSMAGDVLNSLLPRQFPEVPGVRFHSYFKPSGQVGGDLFDVFTVDADRIAILMYDVSGHGVPAALVSVMTKTLFQKHYHPGATVLELLDKLNADLYRDMPGRGFVTLFFGLLDHKKRELRYAGAGFTTPVALSGEELLLLNTKGVPLGIGDRITSQEHVVSFDKPTKLLLFTDGLYEIFNAKDEFYGPKRMTAYINRHAKLPLEDLIHRLLVEHRTFTEGIEQKDDISILGVELDGRGSETIP